MHLPHTKHSSTARLLCIRLICKWYKVILIYLKKKIPHSVDGNMAKYPTQFTVLLSEEDDSRIAEFL